MYMVGVDGKEFKSMENRCVRTKKETSTDATPEDVRAWMRPRPVCRTSSLSRAAP